MRVSNNAIFDVFMSYSTSFFGKYINPQSAFFIENKDMNMD